MCLSLRPCYRKSESYTLVSVVCMLLAECHLNVAARAWQENHYQRLERDLLTNYSPTVRPVLDITTITNISVKLNLFSIHEVDEMVQALTQNSYLVIMWLDEFLQWEPQEYGGVKSTELFSSQIWIPFMEVLNSVSGTLVISPEAFSKVIIKSTGQVFWSHQDVWKTLCHLDVTYFPFDTQRCNFSVYLWTSSTAQVLITDVSAAQDMLVENSEWIILSMDTNRIESPSFDEIYSGFIITFHMKRRRMFHTLTLILPNMLLALLASLVFLLPAESGEKMSFIMGLLLATGVSMTVLMTNMPKSSLDISFLMIYLTALSMTTALAVITSACILRCHSLDGAVGHKTALAVTFLRRLTGNGRAPRKEQAEISKRTCLGFKDNMPSVETVEENHSTGVRPALQDSKGDGSSSREITPTESASDVILWQDAATTLDRVCFLVNVGVVVGMTVIVILLLALG